MKKDKTASTANASEDAVDEKRRSKKKSPRVTSAAETTPPTSPTPSAATSSRLRSPIPRHLRNAKVEEESSGGTPFVPSTSTSTQSPKGKKKKPASPSSLRTGGGGEVNGPPTTRTTDSSRQQVIDTSSRKGEQEESQVPIGAIRVYNNQPNPNEEMDEADGLDMGYDMHHGHANIPAAIAPPLSVVPDSLHSQGATTITTAILVDEEVERQRILKDQESVLRQKILSETVQGQAQIITKENQDKDRQCKRGPLFFLGLFTLIVVIVVIVVLLVRRRSEDEIVARNRAYDVARDQCLSLNGTENLSLPDASLILGSIAAEDAFVDLGHCTRDSLSTEEGLWKKKGQWYAVMGTGTPLQASTCHRLQTDASLSTTVAVFEDCDIVNCLAVSAKGYEVDCGEDGSLSSTTWATTAGRLYHVFVGGEETRQFGLDIAPTVENDICETGIEIGRDTQQSWSGDSLLIVNGSTVDATFDEPPLFCDFIDFGSRKGVWYTYEVGAEGHYLDLNVCNDASDNGNTPRHEVVVYRGDDCRRLECSPAEEESGDVPVSCLASLYAMPFSTQHFFVGVANYPGAGGTIQGRATFGGNFQLRLQKIASGQQCDSPIPVKWSNVLSRGFTVDGSFDSEESQVGACRDAGFGYRGSWISIAKAADADLQLSLDDLNRDVFMSVYGEGCGIQECLSGPDGKQVWTGGQGMESVSVLIQNIAGVSNQNFTLAISTTVEAIVDESAGAELHPSVCLMITTAFLMLWSLAFLVLV